MIAVRTYVALGDSLSCGTDSEYRWPDGLAAALGSEVGYANFATVGATSRDVEERQLGPALAMRPDLLSVICGANDVLESVRPDPDDYAERLGRVFAHIRAQRPTAAIVTATYPDLSRFVELRPRTRDRVRRGTESFNAACRLVAARHGALLVEWSEHTGTLERSHFASDGFHPSLEGHRRGAAEMAEALRERLGIRIRPIEEAA